MKFETVQNDVFDFLPSRNFATKATFFLVAFVTDKKKDHESLYLDRLDEPQQC